MKALLHVHIQDDPLDAIGYSMQEVLDHCAREGFEIVALTGHNKVLIRPEYRAYAEQKNILLISGMERTIESRHVLLYNVEASAEAICTFADLQLYREQHPDMFVIAAHPFLPFFPWRLGEKLLVRYADLFDALEFHWFYTPWLDGNRKTRQIAERLHKPLVGTSDMHTLRHMFYTYSDIQAVEKTPQAVFQAIRQGRVTITTRPYHFPGMVWYAIRGLSTSLFKVLRKKLRLA